MSRLSKVIGWAPAGAFLIGMGASIALRDLLTGKLTPEQLQAVSLAQPAASESVQEADLVAIGRKAQRAQWFAIVGVTTAQLFNIQPVVRGLEKLTGPGVPGLAYTILMTATGASGADAIIHTLQPPSRTGRWTQRLIRANHVSVAGSTVLTIVPWVVQPPSARPASLEEFVTYYRPEVAGFVAALGAQACGPFQAATLFFPLWGEARREPDPFVRTGLRLVAIGALINQGVILIQTVQAFTWWRGNPLLTQKQAALAQMGCQIVTPVFLLGGSSIAPLVENARTRGRRFFTRLWNEDVTAMRSLWQSLLDVYAMAYEPETDQFTATSHDELWTQRARMATEVMDALARAADDLTPTARRRIEQLLGQQCTSELHERVGRAVSTGARTALSVVGGFVPIPAGRWWQALTARPLQARARTDAAAVSAAMQFRASGGNLRNSDGISPHATPVMTFSPRDVDEAVAYLRLLSHAQKDNDVLEAGTAGFFEMSE